MRLGPVSIVLAVSAFCAPATASVPSRNMIPLASQIVRDFREVYGIHIVENGRQGGGTDIIVEGASRPIDAGYRVEIFQSDSHRDRKLWDSENYTKSIEFGNFDNHNVNVKIRDDGYTLTIEACGLHRCGDDINGYLIYFGRSRKSFRARVETKSMDSPGAILTHFRYDITYSDANDVEAQKALQQLICDSDLITRKADLPFQCNAR